MRGTSRQSTTSATCSGSTAAPSKRSSRRPPPRHARCSSASCLTRRNGRASRRSVARPPVVVVVVDVGIDVARLAVALLGHRPRLTRHSGPLLRQRRLAARLGGLLLGFGLGLLRPRLLLVGDGLLTF